MNTCVIYTGVVWLASPAAIVLSVLYANEVIHKFTAWVYIKSTTNMKLTQRK